MIPEEANSLLESLAYEIARIFNLYNSPPNTSKKRMLTNNFGKGETSNTGEFAPCYVKENFESESKQKAVKREDHVN